MTARIEEIRIQNFRAFENARLTLSDLTFLVGRNGAGKSSILDAVEFMREALSDNLPNALARRDGFLGVFPAGAGPDEPLGISVVMSADIAGQRVRILYGFRLRDVGGDIEEVLRVSPKSTLGYRRRNNDFESGANVWPGIPAHRLLLPLIVSNELWQITYDALTRMRGYEISPLAMSAPARIGSRTNLERTGANAADVISDLAQRPEDMAWVVRHLRGVTEGIEDVEVRAERGFWSVRFTQRADAERRQSLGILQVSQGTLRALGILLALRQSPEPSLVIIDEIEDSIHPLAVDVLLEAVEQSSERFPVIVTTHSPEVLARKQATGERIRAVQWRDGVSRLHRLGRGTLEQLDPVTTVGWLLSINGLGLAEPPETWAGDILEWG